MGDFMSNQHHRKASELQVGAAGRSRRQRAVAAGVAVATGALAGSMGARRASATYDYAFQSGDWANTATWYSSTYGPQSSEPTGGSTIPSNTSAGSFDAWVGGNGPVALGGGASFTVDSSEVGNTAAYGVIGVESSDTATYAGGNGILNVSGGTLTFSNDLLVGRGDATGTLNVFAGVLTVAGNTVLGTNQGDASGTTNAQLNTSTGILNMTGGAFNTSAFVMGATSNSTAIANVTGGVLKTTSSFVVNGAPTGGGGTFNDVIFNQSGSAAVNIGGSIYLGNSGLGRGIINLTGGTFTVAGNVFLANSNATTSNVNGTVTTGGNSGVFNVSGGASATVVGAATYLAQGTYGTAVLNVSVDGTGGSYNASGQAIDIASSLGTHGSFATATINLGSGGSISAGQITLAYSVGTIATFNQAGGTVTIASTALPGVEMYLGGTSTYNLSGGTLITPSVASTAGSGSAGSSTFLFNGGTLQANANNTNFISGLTTTQVLAGGAVFNTNSYNVSVGAALTGSAGDGGLTKAGNGTLTLGGTASAFNSASGTRVSTGTGGNSYTGATRITGGTLQLTSLGAPVTILNPSFETPTASSSTAVQSGSPYGAGSNYAYWPAGSSWTYTGDSGITAGGAFGITGTPPDGSQVGFVQAYSDSHATASISQTLTYPATAASYSLSFYSGLRSSTAADPFTVTSGSTTLGTVTPTSAWAQTTYIYTASGSTALTFTGTNGSGSGANSAALIDAVSVNAIGGGTSAGIPSTSSVIISTGATLDLNNSVASIGSLAGGSASNVTLGSSTSSQLTLGNDGTSTVFNGDIFGAGSVVKVGAGQQTFASYSSYTGGTNVSGGTLRANGSEATGTGTVTIYSGGTLGGNGSTGSGGPTGGGAVVVNSGGTITAGASATATGNLSTGSQTWNSGGTFLAKFTTNGTSVTGNDALVMSGLTVSATAGSKFAVTLSNLSTGTVTYSAPIVLADDTVAAGNPFNTASSAATLATLSLTTTGLAAPSGYTLQLATASDGGGGYELILGDVAAAPEPTSLMLLGLAGAPLALGRRRRRASERNRNSAV
jgi:fibronectin-binding autotransporter adhesin